MEKVEEILELKTKLEVKGEPTGKTFTLNKFSDILEIPLDRLDQFMRETQALVEIYHKLNSTLKQTAKVLGLPAPEGQKFIKLCEEDGSFKWTDDGKGEVGFKMKA